MKQSPNYVSGIPKNVCLIKTKLEKETSTGVLSP